MVNRAKRRDKYHKELNERRNKKPCPNCGEPGAHFAPPSFGDEGFWTCEVENRNGKERGEDRQKEAKEELSSPDTESRA